MWGFMKTIMVGLLFFSLISGMTVKAETEQDIAAIKKELSDLRKKQDRKEVRKKTGAAFSAGVLFGYFFAVLYFYNDIFRDKYPALNKLEKIKI